MAAPVLRKVHLALQYCITINTISVLSSGEVRFTLCLCYGYSDVDNGVYVAVISTVVPRGGGVAV